MWTMFKSKDEWLVTTPGALGMTQSARLQKIDQFFTQEEGPEYCVIYFTNVRNNEETFRIEYTEDGWVFRDTPGAHPDYPRAYLEGNFTITAFGEAQSSNS